MNFKPYFLSSVIYLILNLWFSNNVSAQKDSIKEETSKYERPSKFAFNKETGAIQTVVDQDFNKGFIVSPLELAVGKFSNVQISSLTGAPAGNFAVRHQGPSSFYDVTPMIIVDDVPIYNTPLHINPNDIESISMLKDITTASLYSNVANNGAIYITTKRGSNKLSVQYSANFGLSFLPQQIEVFNNEEFRSRINKQYSSNPDAKGLLGSSNTNWQNEIYRNAFSHDQFLSVSGKINKLSLPFRLSVGKTTQAGIVKKSNSDRNTIDISLYPNYFNQQLKISVDFRACKLENTVVNQSVIENAIWFDPTQSVSSSKAGLGGYFEWWNSTSTSSYSMANPVMQLNENHELDKIGSYTSNVMVDYSPRFLHGLSWVTNYNLNRYNRHKTISISPLDLTPYSYGKRFDATSESIENSVLETFLNFEHKFSKIESKIGLKAGISTSSINNYYDHTLYNSWNYLTPSRISTSTFILFKFNFKDRYTLNFNRARIGSSRFSIASSQQAKNSIGFAWDMMKENFLKSNPTFSSFNFHASYGKTSSYLPTEINSPNSGIQVASSYLSNFTSDEIAILSTGVNFGMLNNRIKADFSFFNKRGNKLYVIFPVSSGSELAIQNVRNQGEMSTRCFELNLNVKMIDQTDLKWNWLMNIASNKVSSNADNLKIARQVSDGASYDVLMGIGSNLSYKNWLISFSSRLSMGGQVINYLEYYSHLNFVQTSDLQFGFIRNLPKMVNDRTVNSNMQIDDFKQAASYFKMDNFSIERQFKNVYKKMNMSIAATIQNAFTITSYKGQDPEVMNGIDYIDYPRARTFSLKLAFEF